MMDSSHDPIKGTWLQTAAYEDQRPVKRQFSGELSPFALGDDDNNNNYYHYHHQQQEHCIAMWSTASKL